MYYMNTVMLRLMLKRFMDLQCIIIDVHIGCVSLDSTNPGLARSIPRFSGLSDETLNRSPIFV